MLEGGAFTQCWLRQRLGPGGPCERPQTDAAPGPFNFAVVLSSRMPPAREEVRAQFPAAAPNSYRLRVSTRPSPQNSAHSGRHGGSLPFSLGVVADKQCTCPANKLMWERYPPTPPAFARCDAAGEGCRAAARRAKAGFIAPQCAASARRANFNRGKLDQCTERSLINFFRWV